jgi:hypothetical protein
MDRSYNTGTSGAALVLVFEVSGTSGAALMLVFEVSRSLSWVFKEALYTA